MSIASRHAGAPYADGETLSGADLEADIANIYTVVNGDIDNSNVAAAANIAGTKLADNSVANAKLVDDTITTDKMNAAAVVQGYVSTYKSFTAMVSSTSWFDVTGITPATMTAHSTDDIVCMDFYANVVTGTATCSFAFGFALDGTDVVTDGVLSPFYIKSGEVTDRIVHFTYATTAPGTSAMTIAPRMKYLGGTSTGVWASCPRVFRVQIIPVKS